IRIGRGLFSIFLLSFGDHGDLNVLREPEYLRYETSRVNQIETPVGRSGQENLRNLMTMCEIHEGGGCMLSLQYSRFDMEIACEVEMLFNGLTLPCRQLR